MTAKETKNVLVLGTTGFKITQFCKLFEGYLSYDYYEEAINWQPTLTIDDGIKRSLICINNLHLICTPYLEDSHLSKQIVSTLPYFQERQSLSAIIILLKPNQKNNNHLWKLKNFLLHELKEYPDNILYVYALNNNFYKCQEVINKQLDIFENSKVKKTNKFYFNEDTFYNVTSDNWSESTDFCKTIYNYIVGSQGSNGLRTHYISTNISKEILLNLINNLLQLLIQIYIGTSTIHFFFFDTYNYKQKLVFIGDFKRNITVCHSDQCITWKQYTNELCCTSKIKIPKIGKASCNCNQTNTIAAKCAFETTNGTTCMQCGCKDQFHSENYFTYMDKDYINVEQERRIAINIFATFYLFKTQNNEALDLKEIFTRILDIQIESSKTIYETFVKELNAKVKELEEITNIDVVKCLNSLYEIKHSATIIPKYMEEIFPEDFRLAIIPSNKSTKNEYQTKIRLATKVGELDLANNKNPVCRNANDLNSDLNQEGEASVASGSNLNLNENEEGNDEKVINWNIERK